ncbi:hypothetical protein V8E36_008275 [Tilletia maclaganii]
MKHVRTFLLVAMGLVGLAVSGPVTMEGTAQIQQHNLERGQILDKRAPDPPHHHIPGPPHEYEPLPEPHDSRLVFLFLTTTIETSSSSIRSDQRPGSLYEGWPHVLLGAVTQVHIAIRSWHAGTRAALSQCHPPPQRFADIPLKQCLGGIRITSPEPLTSSWRWSISQLDSASIISMSGTSSPSGAPAPTVAKTSATSAYTFALVAPTHTVTGMSIQKELRQMADNAAKAAFALAQFSGTFSSRFGKPTSDTNARREAGLPHHKPAAAVVTATPIDTSEKQQPSRTRARVDLRPLVGPWRSRATTLYHGNRPPQALARLALPHFTLTATAIGPVAEPWAKDAANARALTALNPDKIEVAIETSDQEPAAGRHLLQWLEPIDPTDWGAVLVKDEGCCWAGAAPEAVVSTLPLPSSEAAPSASPSSRSSRGPATTHHPHPGRVQADIQPYKEQGVTLKTVDYGSIDSFANALQDIDALLGTQHKPSLPQHLATAAHKAGGQGLRAPVSADGSALFGEWLSSVVVMGELGPEWCLSVLLMYLPLWPKFQSARRCQGTWHGQALACYPCAENGASCVATELGSYGIAFHHAGMEIDDRRAVEQAFLSSDIKVLYILAKYFLSFKTMLKLLEVPANATINQAATEDLKDIRMRQGEKNLFTTLCKNEEIRFPPTKVNGVKEKISLLLQAVLAGMSLQECLGSKTAGYSPTLDAFVVSRHAPRIVRAMFDIFLAKRHGQALQNSFTLLRCINGRSWEAKSTILRQLDGYVIRGYGDKLVTQAESFPHFHLDVEEDASERLDEGVQVTIKIRAGLDDTGVKVKTSRKESGAALSISSISGKCPNLGLTDRLKKLTTDQEFKVRCTLSRPSQRIVVTAACDEIAGSAVRSELRHSVPSTMFPQLTLVGKSTAQLNEEAALQELEECIESFDRDDELNLDLEEGGAGSKRVAVIDASTRPAQPSPAPSKDSHVAPKDQRELSPEPIKLPNGNYKCLHNCKSSCRHLCCREGMERPPHRRKGANKKGAASTERNVGTKGPAKAVESPSLLDRFRALEGREASSNANAKKSTGTQASNAGSAKRGPQSQSKERTTSTKPLTSGNREDVFSERDDELPLIASRSHRANASTKSTGMSTTKTPAVPGRAKQKRPKPWSMLKYQDRDDQTELLDDLEEDDDAGSLQDFIVDDDVDLFATHSDEGDPERLSKGDLQDHDMEDDLAHLFQRQRERSRKGTAVKSKQSAPAAIDDEDVDVDLGPRGDDGPLFFSEDAALGLDDAKPTTSPPSSPVQGPGRAQPGQGTGPAEPMQGFTKWFSGARLLGLDEDEEVVNEDMALSASTPIRGRGSGSEKAKTLSTTPAPAPAPAQMTRPAPVMRRPTFADRKLAQRLQTRAAKSAPAATSSSAAGPSSGRIDPPTMPSPTGGHVDGYTPTGASVAGQDTGALAKLQAAPAQPAPAANEEEEDVRDGCCYAENHPELTEDEYAGPHHASDYLGGARDIPARSLPAATVRLDLHALSRSNTI